MPLSQNAAVSDLPLFQFAVLSEDRFRPYVEAHLCSETSQVYRYSLAPATALLGYHFIFFHVHDFLFSLINIHDRNSRRVFRTLRAYHPHKHRVANGEHVSM